MFMHHNCSSCSSIGYPVKVVMSEVLLKTELYPHLLVVFSCNNFITTIQTNFALIKSTKSLTILFVLLERGQKAEMRRRRILNF